MILKRYCYIYTNIQIKVGSNSLLYIFYYFINCKYIIKTLITVKRSTIGSLDMLIAAHPLALNLTLVTNNVKEFKRVNGLIFENQR